jgi:hypothetical protein
MEEWMPRHFGLKHFGLKATSAAERSGLIMLSNATLDLGATAAPSMGLSPENTLEAKLSSPALALPFSPASWRGCHGRRSISAN